MSTKPKPRSNLGKRKSMRKKRTIIMGQRAGNAISGGRWLQPIKAQNIIDPPP